ncbi:MAG TPA: hypothetical protein VHD56_14150 [Tepidisphaeraceae bacterium]|nr:hypothetical protein [Tepidisphaeraceae bacterium]
MSCWVVPSVAAELWGVSVNQILDSIRGGSVPSKSEAGFTFVDVAPNSPKLHTPKPLREPTPQTYTVVTEAEIEALTGEEDSTMADWRDARAGASRLRRRPMAA